MSSTSAPPAPDQAIYLPCKTCGAPIPLHLTAFTLACSYCGSQQSLSPDMLAKARGHLEVLAHLQAEYTSAERGARYFSQQNRGWVKAIRISAGVVGLMIIVAGGAFGGQLRPTLEQRLGDTLASVLEVLLFIGSCVVGIWAGLQVVKLIPKVRPNTDLQLRPADVGRVICSHCGATLPVLLGQHLSCPFCDADLLEGERTERLEEQVAARQVSAMADQEATARAAYLADADYRSRTRAIKAIVIMGGPSVGGILAVPWYFVVEHFGLSQTVYDVGVVLALACGLFGSWCVIRRVNKNVRTPPGGTDRGE